MKTAIVNLGQIVSGDWKSPFAAGDAILTDGERIVSVGTASAQAVESADVVIDAGGTTAIPGLIDSHVHITFGDFTPRQNTVGYLESYLHGGVTTAISASEAQVLRALSSRRDEGACRLGDPRAHAPRQRPRRDRQAGRVARQGRLRRVQD